MILNGNKGDKMSGIEDYTLETLRVSIDSKISELQVGGITDKQYDVLLDELNTLLIYKGYLT